jgi:hypothetical protein
MKYCALCCIAKDEDLFLKEWLTYHALIGVEHFFIYDNLSAVPIAQLLDGWASPARVTVIRNPEELTQGVVYTHCLQHYGNEFKWIAFLDVDDFIRLSPTAGELADIRIFLAEFEPYAGVGLNWRMFSSSGHDITPPAPVIGSYTRTFGDDAHIKSVVQPAKVCGCAGPHAFHPNAGEYAVNAARFPIPPGFPFTVPATDKAAINHYFYKSRQCFAHKIAKGNPCNIERRMQDFERHLLMPDERDDSLLAYAPRVAALLNNPAKGLHTADAPRAPAGEAPPHDGPTHLFAARRFLLAGKLRQALLNLCHAVLHNERDTPPDPVFSLDVWTLRAEAAVLSGDRELAEHCLRQAFTFGAGHKTFGLFANFLLQQGRRKEAKAIMDILSTYKSFESADGEAAGSELLPEGRARLDADKSWWRLADKKA